MPSPSRAISSDSRPPLPLSGDQVESLLRYLESCRDEMVSLLRRLIEIETPSEDPASFRPLREELASRFRSLDYHPRHVAGQTTGGILYARPRQRTHGNPYQLILGHGDTVWPHGTLDENPVEVDEERVKGPGAFDMKGGLVQTVYALKALGHLGVEPEVTPVVLINSDEEIGSPESTRHIRRLARGADRAYVLEPALGPRGRIKTTRKGVGHFEITVTGRASHAGLSPEQGASAILGLSRLIQALHELNDHEAGVTVNVGVIEGGMRPNVVAPRSRAEVDVRVQDGDQAERVEQAIRNLSLDLEGVSLSVKGGFRRPPMEPTEGNRMLWERAREVGELLGLQLEETASGGASDGNTTSQYTPTLDGLGAVGDGAHESYEYARIDGLIERGALLALLVTLPSLPASPRS